MNTLDVREDYDWNDTDDEFHSTETGEYVEMFAAPTKAEAIDWLESKGVIIEVLQDYGEQWFYVTRGRCACEVFPTRLEAEEAAIIKALKLL